MSEFEDDIDDQLLELAGATEKKRKRHSGAHSKSSSKKRKADPMDSESEKEPESEDDAAGSADPYPLEGQYKDEADRQRLLEMPETAREEILAERSEKKQRLNEQQKLADLLNQRSAIGTDSVAKAAKRQHTVRGATKEKTRKLDELKARRKAKDEKKRNTSPKRDRSSSPMDMEISDEESEDGQITKQDQEEEKERRLLGKTAAAPDNTPSTLQHFESCRLSRDTLAKYCMAPWFQDYVRGAWVRYLIGQEAGQPVYRMCEIADLSKETVKPYKVNDKLVNQGFDLKHGTSIRSFNMDKVSNGPFIEKEFDRLVKVYAAEDAKLPTKLHLEQKVAQLQKLVSQPVTESDISAMLQRRNQVQNNKPTGMSTLERSRLTQARTLAMRRHDYDEVKDIDTQLAAAESIPVPARVEAVDVLAKVNERNRKANQEAVRRAEMAESERKRRERKLVAAGGTLTPQDPSARLKTVPRLFNAATPTSRPGTPLANGTTGAVTPQPPSGLVAKTAVPTKSFEASMLDSIEIDLGDF